MPALSDVRFAALRSLGYTGATSDMLLAWLIDQSIAIPPAVTVPDAWANFLNENIPVGAGAYDRNDYWFGYLGEQGYVGQMNDREIQFWLNLPVLEATLLQEDGFQLLQENGDKLRIGA